jgi:hypothetical protein
MITVSAPGPRTVRGRPPIIGPMHIVNRRHAAVVAGIVIAVIVGCVGPIVWARHAYTEAKDQRDFHDLTRSWPRSLYQLPVPDELPATGVTGDVSSTGISLWYRSAEGAAAPLAILYEVQLLDEWGEPLWDVSCRAHAVVVCTDLGSGYILVRNLDTDNSDPGTSVRRRVDDRLFSAAVLGDHPEAVDRLRRIITETHVPAEAELLRILRPDGYQTDWT